MPHLSDLEQLAKQLSGMAERCGPGAQLFSEDVQALAKSVHLLLEAEIERTRQAPDPWDDETVEREAIQMELPRVTTIWDRLRKPMV